jgi:hypothetical protein
MKPSLGVRACAWSGAAALILTVGFMARRTTGDARVAAPEELRDAVASPAPAMGARLVPSAGVPARFALRAKNTVSARLSRFADAADAKAASMRRSVQSR